MRFISNKVRDAYFDQRRPKRMRYEDAVGAAEDRLLPTLTPEQFRLLDAYMEALFYLRHEEQMWYFQRGWLAGQKEEKAGKTP